jgi:voltage-gated potassium channel
MSQNRTLIQRLPINLNSAITRAVLVCVAVLLVGTLGFSWIENWNLWDSFFFTLYTLTTVGYDDAEIGPGGQVFGAILMIGGIGSVSYALSQIVQYAATNAIDTEKRMITKANKLSNHCIVCGLGRTGLHVIQRLDDQGIPIVAIDRDESLVKQARDRGIIAIHDDATSDHTLIFAGIKRASALAACTSSDSANAMICLTANALAPDIPISARAEDEDSINKLTRAGATSVISPTRYGGEGIADSMLRPSVAEVLYGNNDECDKKLHFREISITKHNHRAGLSIAQIIDDFPSIAYIASRTAAGDYSMRPGTDQVLNDGDFLLIAGQNHDLAEIERCTPDQQKAAA